MFLELNLKALLNKWGILMEILQIMEVLLEKLQFKPLTNSLHRKATINTMILKMTI